MPVNSESRERGRSEASVSACGRTLRSHDRPRTVIIAGGRAESGILKYEVGPQNTALSQCVRQRKSMMCSCVMLGSGPTRISD